MQKWTYRNNFESLDLSGGLQGIEMKTVLIVEDEAMVLVLAESVVQSAGYQTLTASSLAEARSIVESGAKIDIVFTDLSLGEETDGGIDVGNLVAEKRPGTSVLYTSGRGLTDGLSSLFIAGSDFLPKPYTDTQVVERLLNLAEGC